WGDEERPIPESERRRADTGKSERNAAGGVRRTSVDEPGIQGPGFSTLGGAESDVKQLPGGAASFRTDLALGTAEVSYYASRCVTLVAGARPVVRLQPRSSPPSFHSLGRTPDEAIAEGTLDEGNAAQSATPAAAGRLSGGFAGV